MIWHYIKIMTFIIIELVLGFVVSPELINLHENMTTICGFAIWIFIIPVFAYLFIKHYIMKKEIKSL